MRWFDAPARLLYEAWTEPEPFRGARGREEGIAELLCVVPDGPESRVKGIEWRDAEFGRNRGERVQGRSRGLPPAGAAG